MSVYARVKTASDREDAMRAEIIVWRMCHKTVSPNSVHFTPLSDFQELAKRLLAIDGQREAVSCG